MKPSAPDRDRAGACSKSATSLAGMSPAKEYERIRALDREHVWHPFTQMAEWSREESPLVLVEGNGVFLRDVRGRWYLDGISSMWCNIHGHRNPDLDAALRAQIGRVAHTTLLGAANQVAAELAGDLADLLPDPLNRVFYSDNGSTAVEVALKMAYQYWRHRGQGNRSLFVALENAYHGDTLGAVAVGGIDLFHGAFGDLLFETKKAPSPYCYRCGEGLQPQNCRKECVAAVEAILSTERGRVAGVILEPLIQAAGGMITHPAGYLREIAELCRRYDTLLILDEVATGFGRTGRMFAFEHEGVVPDLLCLSKGITGGYLPLAATVASDRIYEAFLGEYREMKQFFHGHTYTGNPLACAVARAGLGLLAEKDFFPVLADRIEQFSRWLRRIAEYEHVGQTRSVGLMGGVELVRNKADGSPFPWEEQMGWKVVRRCRDKGLLLRPLGSVLVLMPPLVISSGELDRMMETVADAIAEEFSPA